MRSASFFLSLALVAAGLPARAAFSNENSLLVGDRAAGMGGATVAVTGDAAGSPFYNPGTLAFLEGQAFSAAVGVYKKFDMLYGEEEDFTRAPLRVNQGFFRSLPASTANVVRWTKLPDWTLAFSVVVPDYEQFKGDLRSDALNVSTLTYTEESLWVGGSMSRRISGTEGVGLTLYYTARSYASSVSDRSTPNATDAEIYTLEKTITENAIVPIVGYYNDAGESWKWGVAVRLPSLKLAGRATAFESDTKVAGGTVTLNPRSAPEEGVRVHIPGKVTVGWSYRPDPTLLIAGDVSLREGMSYLDVEDSAFARDIRHKAVVNMAFGVEKEFAEWLRVRTGVYTNLSSQPDPNPELQREQEDHVDMLGFSANFVFVAGQKISYTFGGYYTGGRGRSIQRIDQTYTVVPKTVHVFTMLVGTSFSF